MIASALAVELLASVLQHPEKLVGGGRVERGRVMRERGKEGRRRERSFVL